MRFQKLINGLFGIVATMISVAAQAQSVSVVCESNVGEQPTFEFHRRSGQLQLTVRDQLMVESIGIQLHDSLVESRTSFKMVSVDELCVPSATLDPETVFECVFHRYGHFELADSGAVNVLRGGIADDVHPSEVVSTPSRVTIRKIDNGSVYRITLGLVLTPMAQSGLTGVYLERKFMESKCRLVK